MRNPVQSFFQLGPGSDLLPFVPRRTIPQKERFLLFRRQMRQKHAARNTPVRSFALRKRTGDHLYRMGRHDIVQDHPRIPFQHRKADVFSRPFRKLLHRGKRGFGQRGGISGILRQFISLPPQCIPLPASRLLQISEIRQSPDNARSGRRFQSGGGRKLMQRMRLPRTLPYKLQKPQSPFHYLNVVHIIYLSHYEIYFSL